MRVGGKAVEGGFVVSGPAVLADGDGRALLNLVEQIADDSDETRHETHGDSFRWSGAEALSVFPRLVP